MRFDRELTGNSRESSNFLPFHHPSFCFLWTVFLYFFIFHYPHYASQKTDLDLLFHKLASNVCVQTTPSGRLVGSCSQSLQTSDQNRLGYAPLCGAGCNRRLPEMKKVGHSTGPHSDEMPLMIKVTFLLFSVFPLSVLLPFLPRARY